MQKNCKNCQSSFEITEEDINFYHKVSPVFNKKKYTIDPPTICPSCRLQRKLAWRNERNLYHGTCDHCNKKIISIFSEDKPHTVYCTQCWWGDKWDALSYGKDFDFMKTFMEQFNELMLQVPQLHLLTLGDNINSDYTHDNYRLKNCYLIFDGVEGEDRNW